MNVQVTEHYHRYLREAEMREEGGTPAIVESIRAGLVFQLKEVLCTAALFKPGHFPSDARTGTETSSFFTLKSVLTWEQEEKQVQA